MKSLSSCRETERIRQFQLQISRHIVLQARPSESELPRDADLLGLCRTAGETLRTGGAVHVWKERRDVGDGSQKQRAVLGAFILRQREDHVVLVPHVESVVGKRVGRRVTKGHAKLGVGVCALFFISSWTQHTI